MCGVVDNPDEIALAAREDTQGESEFRLPSGPVSEAETLPVTVAGVNRSIHKRAWYQAMEKEMKELVEWKTFTVMDEFPYGKKGVGSRWGLSYKSD